MKDEDLELSEWSPNTCLEFCHSCRNIKGNPPYLAKVYQAESVKLYGAELKERKVLITPVAITAGYILLLFIR